MNRFIEALKSITDQEEKHPGRGTHIAGALALFWQRENPEKSKPFFEDLAPYFLGFEAEIFLVADLIWTGRRTLPGSEKGRHHERQRDAGVALAIHRRLINQTTATDTGGDSSDDADRIEAVGRAILRLADRKPMKAGEMLYSLRRFLPEATRSADEALRRRRDTFGDEGDADLPQSERVSRGHELD